MPNEYAYLYTIFSLIPSKKIPLIINKLRLFFKKKFGIIIFLLCVFFFTIDFYVAMYGQCSCFIFLIEFL